MITERLMAAGSWDVPLLPDAPRSLLSDLTYFGFLSVTPGWLNPTDVADITQLAIYTGVYTGRSRRGTQLSGYGLAYLLGASGGFSDLYESETDYGPKDFDDFVNENVLRNTGPQLNGIVQGSIGNPGSNKTLTIEAGASPLDVLNQISDLWDIDWRINPNRTLDAYTTVYSTTPVAVVTPWWSGRDLGIIGWSGTLDTVDDVESFTTRYVAEADGAAAFTVGDADISTNPFTMPDGDPLERDQYGHSKLAKTSGDADTVAARRLARFDQIRRQITATIDTYAVRSELEPGGWVYVYDPDLGLVDTTAEVYFRGHCLHPLAVRCHAIRWPIQQGMGVYLTCSDSAHTVIDLTPWVDWEQGESTLELGAPWRTLNV